MVCIFKRNLIKVLFKKLYFNFKLQENYLMYTRILEFCIYFDNHHFIHYYYFDLYLASKLKDRSINNHKYNF